MSENVDVETTAAQTKSSELPAKARKAFFNPFNTVRAEALKELRASSAFSPEEWEQIDEELNIKDDDGEVTAASAAPVDAGLNFSDDVTGRHYNDETLVDTLAGAGFGVGDASLADYAYFDLLRNSNLSADTQMGMRTESNEDMVAYGLDGVPLPLDIVTVEIDGREFEVHQAHGEDISEILDGQEARRALNEAEEKRLFNGWGNDVETEHGVLTVEGLDSDIDQILQASASSGWNSGDGSTIMDDIDDMMATVEEQSNVDNPEEVPLVEQVGAHVIIPRKYYGKLTREDYETSATDEPVLDRLNRKYPYITFHAAKYLDADSCIMLLDDRRYFKMVNAQSPTSTSFDVDGGAALKVRVVSSRVPFIKAQPDGIAGVVRKTGIDA